MLLFSLGACAGEPAAVPQASTESTTCTAVAQDRAQDAIWNGAGSDDVSAIRDYAYNSCVAGRKKTVFVDAGR